MPIEEHRSNTRYNDISTVRAFLAQPVIVNTSYTRRCDVFSCFSNDYSVGKEREFIEYLDNMFPGKYTRYAISWSDAN